MTNNIQKIAEELKITIRQVSATVALLDEGATVPFIARYRKEVTGSLDEVAITQIRDRITQLRELDKRREAILKSLTELEKLTPELEKQIQEAETLAKLEDIYLPYKPKRRTRATIAREKGLEPLADVIFTAQSIDLEKEAKKYINSEKGVETFEEALAGARDIIAEKVSEDQNAREQMRNLYQKKATFTAKVISGKEEEGQKYKDYFDWSESIAKAPSHRVLALRRAEKEMIISLDTAPEEDEAVEILDNLFVKGTPPIAEQLEMAVKDGYKRLLAPSMETEFRMRTKKKADEEAINVFTDNLRELLLAAPLGQRRILAIDPGFRTGCKVVILNENGKLLDHSVIYPNEPQRKSAQAGIMIRELCKDFEVQSIAIGNGTASRETEQFIRSLKLSNIDTVMVNESGASVYSASEIAREEFPDHDVTVRGAVSIGRRLADPLAELVKIDPKSIGVGQYQHDVDQTQLKQSLDDVVVSCVNAVGVEVNTASKKLLMYVSGLGQVLAQNIINYRNENGGFKSRAELKKVPRLGKKAFEQAAGFLRVRGAKNPLDESAVHPESYPIVQKMAKDLDATIPELVKNADLRKNINLKNYVTDTVGLPTLTDILKELDKPGRDPREKFESFSFTEGIEEMADLREGMYLPGIVTNVTNFGAFVDIGVHQDGLVHLSQMADRFIRHPSEVVKVQQKVMVTVLTIDEKRRRISLSMKGQNQAQKSTKPLSKNPKKTAKKELSFEEKLARLRSKFD